MPEPSRLYLPLRGNAHTLVAGAPANAFRRRLKVAALLFDLLVLETGAWIGMSGPKSSIEFVSPTDEGLGFPDGRWQTAKERDHGGRPFSLDMKGSDSWLRVVESPTTVWWRATYTPIQQELPEAYDWIEFADVDLYPKDKDLAKRMAGDAVADGLLVGALPDFYTRQLVTRNMTHGALLAARMGTALSLDGLHSQAASLFVARGQAHPVLGAQALMTVLPEVRDLPWDQVNEARKLKGLPKLRAVLAELEGEARTSGGRLDEAILRGFQRDYSRAVDETESALGAIARSVVIGGAVSIVTFPVAGPTGVLASVAFPAIIEAGIGWRRNERRKNRWTTAADDLRRMADEASTKSEQSENEVAAATIRPGPAPRVEDDSG